MVHFVFPNASCRMSTIGIDTSSAISSPHSGSSIELVVKTSLLKKKFLVSLTGASIYRAQSKPFLYKLQIPRTVLLFKKILISFTITYIKNWISKLKFGLMQNIIDLILPVVLYVCEIGRAHV